MNILPLAMRNVKRNWHRTLVTVGSMAFAGMIMILYVGLMEGMVQGGKHHTLSVSMGELQVYAKGYRDDPDMYKRIPDSQAVVNRLNEKGFHATQRLHGYGLAASGTSSAGVQIRGVHLESELRVTTAHNYLLSGEWLAHNDPKGIVIGRKLARTLSAKIGDEVIILSQATDGSMANDLYRLRGVLKSISEDIDRAGFFMLDTSFRDLFILPTGSHEIVIMRNGENQKIEDVTTELSELLPNYEVINWRILSPILSQILDLTDASIYILLIITYIAVAILVLNAMLMSVFERIREFGIMKAIGFGPMQLMLLIYAETLIQVVSGVVLALLAGIPLTYYFQVEGIDLTQLISGGITFGGMAFDPIWRAELTERAIVSPIVTMVVISCLAVIYPAIKAAIIRPVSAIHHQ